MKFILGMGNILRGDDGIGPRIIEYILENNLENGFSCQDIGTNIWHLLPILEAGTEKILLIDAVQMGKSSGSVDFFTLDNVNILPKSSLSQAHDGELLLLLKMLKQSGGQIPDICIMGIQPQSLNYQMQLSNTLQNKIEHYVQQALVEIGV